ncbi:MAG: hypothetical protein AMXMBFR67_29970 [Nitrospira sp.]
MSKKSGFRLAFAHRGLKQQNSGVLQLGECFGNSLLQGARHKAKYILESLWSWSQWGSRLPANYIQGLLGTDSPPFKPRFQVVTIGRASKCKPLFIRTNPIGKTGKSRE